MGTMMPMSEEPGLERQVRSRMRDVLLGHLDLTAFEAWLVQVTWDADPALPGADLAFDLGLLLAEYSSGHATRQDVMEHLRASLGRHVHITRSTGMTRTLVHRERSAPLVAAHG